MKRTLTPSEFHPYDFALGDTLQVHFVAGYRSRVMEVRGWTYGRLDGVRLSGDPTALSEQETPSTLYPWRDGLTLSLEGSRTRSVARVVHWTQEGHTPASPTNLVAVGRVDLACDPPPAEQVVERLEACDVDTGTLRPGDHVRITFRRRGGRPHMRYTNVLAQLVPEGVRVSGDALSQWYPGAEGLLRSGRRHQGQQTLTFRLDRPDSRKVGVERIYVTR